MTDDDTKITDNEQKVEDEDIVALRNLNKTIKDKGIKIALIYSKEYMEKN